MKNLKNNLYLLRCFVCNGGLLHIFVIILLRLLNIFFNVWFSIYFPLQITEYLLNKVSFKNIAITIIITILSIVFLTFFGAIYNKYIGKLAEENIINNLKEKFYKKVSDIDLLQ